MKRILLLLWVAMCIGCKEEPRFQGRRFIDWDVEDAKQEEKVPPPHGPVYAPVEEVKNENRLIVDEPIDEATATLLNRERPEESPEFGALIVHPNHHVRKQAIKRLKDRPSFAQPSFTEQLTQALSDPSAQIRHDAAELLVPVPETHLSLAKMIEDPDKDASWEAAHTLKKAGLSARSIVPVLVEIIQSPHSRHHEPAIYALGFIGGDQARAIIPELKGFLEDHKLDGVSARALVQLGEIDFMIARVRADAQQGECRFGFALAIVNPTTEEIQSTLIEACQKCEGFDRGYAFRALQDTQPTTERVVAFLRQSLTHSNSSVRTEAAEAFQSIQPVFDSSLPALVKALNDPNERVREKAANVIKRFKTNNETKMQAYIEMALQESPIRNIAVQGSPGLMEPLFITYIENRQHDEKHRAAALRLLRPWTLPPTETTLALAKKILGDEQEQVSLRSIAACILVVAKQQHEQAIPALIAGVQAGAYDEVRELAAEGLGDLQAAEGMDALIGALDDKNNAVVEAAVKSLGEFGESAAAAIPRLQQLASDESKGNSDHRNVRQAAVVALGKIDLSGKETLPLLIKILNTPHTGFDTLLELDAIQAITLIAIKSEEQREAAAAALVSQLKKEHGHQDVVEGFTLLTEKTNFFAVDPPSPSALAAREALSAALQDSYKEVRRLAAKALAKQGPSASSAAEPLVQAFLAEPKENDSNRYAYLDALGDTGGAPELVVPVLIDALELPLYSRYAVRALEIYGTEAAPAIPKLIELLGHEDRYERYLSAQVLGCIGPKAQEAIEPLQKLLDDKEIIVRNNAQEALEKINPPK